MKLISAGIQRTLALQTAAVGLAGVALVDGGGHASLGGDPLTTALPAARDADFHGLRLFIYPLHRAYNAELLNELAMQAQQAGSECDFMLSPCTESRWLGKLSQARQRGAEVIILRKLLSSPMTARVHDPRDADFFVVPYLAATDCLLGGFQLNCVSTRTMGNVFSKLQYYNHVTRHRHLFFGTADMHSLPFVIQSQPLLISRGSFWGDHPGHVVVPSAVVEAELQPGAFRDRGTHDRDILFWLAQTPNNIIRYAIQKQLLDFGSRLSEEERLRDFGLSGTVRVHVMERGEENLHTVPAPATVVGEMMRARFCPAPPAENPSGGTKRLFDAILAGCLPVVVAFSTVWGSGISWWRHDGPPIEGMLPFPWEIDWRRLAVEVPTQALEDDSSLGFVRAVSKLSAAEVAAKRDYLLEVRGLLLYDLVGGTRDVFSLVMERIRAALPQLSPRAVFPTLTPFGSGLPAGAPRVQSAAVICDSAPLRSDPRKLSLPLFAGMEKAWRHSFGEVACLPIHSWRAPAAALTAEAGRGAPLPALVAERHVAVRMLRTRLGTTVTLQALTASRVPPGGEHGVLAASPFAACVHEHFPRACHDFVGRDGTGGYVFHFCQDFARPPGPLLAPNTTCRMLPALAPVPPVPLLSPASGTPTRWEVVVRACRGEGRLEHLGQRAEARWASMPPHHALHAVFYEVCRLAMPRGRGLRRRPGDLVFIEHIVAVMHEQRRGHPTADALLFLAGTAGAEGGGEWAGLKDMARLLHGRLPDMQGERADTEFPGRLRGAPLKWLAVVGERGSGRHLCDAYSRLASVLCPVTEAMFGLAPKAVAFSAELLRDVVVNEWEVLLGGPAAETDSEALFDLLLVLLMRAATESKAAIWLQA